MFSIKEPNKGLPVNVFTVANNPFYYVGAPSFYARTVKPEAEAIKFWWWWPTTSSKTKIKQRIANYHSLGRVSSFQIPSSTTTARFFHSSPIRCGNNNNNNNNSSSGDSSDVNLHGFTHVSANNVVPTMVDILDKRVTKRSATAQAIVEFPIHVLEALQATTTTTTTPSPTSSPPKNEEEDRRGGRSEISSAKGPVFSTAIIAGTMAVKRTSDLIPFCHPLPIESCRFNIYIANSSEVVITCCVQVTHKTGVEMEALVGASVAALTVYDMCKALSHDIVLKETKLLEKAGGKNDFNHNPQ
jgi:cyclic pyranopterin phosphate synthase